MASKLKQIQSDIEARVDALLLDVGINALSRLRGNITNDILATIAQKKIAVLCFPPSVGGIKSNVASCLDAQECSMQIRVIETPKLNNSGTDAYEIIERLMSLNLFKTSDGTLVSIKTIEDASPDAKPIVEFVLELQMAIRFPRIQTQ